MNASALYEETMTDTNGMLRRHEIRALSLFRSVHLALLLLMIWEVRSLNHCGKIALLRCLTRARRLM